MDNQYKEIEFCVGRNIDECVNELLVYKNKGELVFGNFNGHKLYSDSVTIDSVYKEITGSIKKEFDENIRKQNEEYERQKQEHIDSIPEKTKMWMQKGREILEKDKLELWDKIVPIRLNDLYQGMELKCCLDIIKILKDGTLEEAKKEIENQNHSEMSFNLVRSMVKEFSTRGQEFFDYVK
jgi:hypothetical protein